MHQGRSLAETELEKKKMDASTWRSLRKPVSSLGSLPFHPSLWQRVSVQPALLGTQLSELLHRAHYGLVCQWVFSFKMHSLFLVLGGVCVCTHVKCRCLQSPEEAGWPGVEFQVVVIQLKLVLGTELWSSERAICPLSHKAISLAAS